MEWIKRHITLLVVSIIAFTLVLPIGINALYFINTDYKILHKPSEWTIFWGGYLGSIISTGVAFVILAIQYQQNRKENKKNRDLQINILKYQQNFQWLNELKAKCVDFYKAFDQNDIIDLHNLLNKNNSVSLTEAEQLVNFLIDRNNKVIFELEFQFSKNKDNEEIRLLSKLENYNHIYKALICDAQYIIKRFKKGSNVYNLYVEIDEYTKRNTIPQVKSNRIVSILNSVNYIGRIGGLSDILNKLFIARKDFHSTLIQSTLNELINYEEDKINNIINDKENVTK